MKLTTFTLGVVSVFFVTLVSAVVLSDIVTIQRGNGPGSCDQYMQILDKWHEEAIFSLSNAQDAVDEHYNEDTRLGRKVRASMFSFFQVAQAPSANGVRGTAKTIRDNFSRVLSWLNNGLKGMKKENIYLFCGSDFLVQRNPDDVAQDFEGNDIMVNGDLIPITSVPGYGDALKKGQVPWWSGDHSDLKGYWFEAASSGANYCNSNLGLTGVIRILKPTNSRQSLPTVSKKQIIILCPSAFSAVKFKDSFEKGAQDLDKETEKKDLEWALPKSATFTHEAFHVVHGTNFNEGGEYETYGLTECINMAGSNEAAKISSARKNPENYVYFTSAMHYLLEEELPKRWDFCEKPEAGSVFDGSEDDEMGDA